jgi:type II secretory pathway pseudopilin PulG
MRRRRAFSILELLLCIALTGLVLSLTFFSLRQGQAAEQSHALAQTLADRFRAARESALATGVPVGVAFPAGSPLLQSLYMLQGEARGVPAGNYRWSREFGQAAAFFGYWHLDAGGSWTLGTELAGTQTLDLAQWAPQPGDRLYVYLPSGRLVSNQPAFGGSHRIVCSIAAQYQSGSVEGQAAPRLTGAGKPWTLALRGDGAVDLLPGVEGNNNLAALQPGLANLAVPSPLTRPDNTDPVLDAVEPCPPPAPGSLPLNVDASVTPAGYITFAAYATDAQSDHLSCRWKCDEGGLSAGEECEMEWDSSLQKWVSHWTFTPPPGAQVGQIYTLNCTVVDGRNGKDEGTFGVGGRILVTRKSRLAYLSNCLTNDIMRLQVFVCNVDGTERKVVTRAPAHLLAPRWSPDGSRILYLTAPAENTPHQLRSVNPDGTDDTLLLDPGATWSSGIYATSYSFDGNQIWALASHDNSFDLVGMNTDGTNQRVITLSGPPLPSSRPSWNGLAMHPTTGNLLIVNSAGVLSYVDPDAGISYPVQQAETPQKMELAFSPDGGTLFFSKENASLHKATFTFDGTKAVVEPSTPMPVSGTVQTPSLGFEPDTIFYQRELSPTNRRLMRYSLGQNQVRELTNSNFFEDDCWVTAYPETELP